MSVSLYTTVKGKEGVSVDGYNYRMDRVLVSGNVSWRCITRTCKSTLRTNSSKTSVTGMSGTHSHDPHSSSPVRYASTPVSGSLKLSSVSPSESSDYALSPEPSASPSANSDRLSFLIEENSRLKLKNEVLRDQWTAAIDRSIQNDLLLLEIRERDSSSVACQVEERYVSCSGLLSVKGFADSSSQTDEVCRCKEPTSFTNENETLKTATAAVGENMGCEELLLGDNKNHLTNRTEQIEVGLSKLADDVLSLKNEVAALQSKIASISIRGGNPWSSNGGSNLLTPYCEIGNKNKNYNKFLEGKGNSISKEANESKFSESPNSFLDSVLDFDKKSMNKILILGDSHTRGFGSLLTRELGDDRFQIISVFKPGARLQDVVGDICGLTRGFTADDVVVVCGGTNDISRTSPYQYTIDKGMRMLEAVSLYTNVVFMEILPRFDCYLAHEIYIANSMIQQRVQKLFSRGHSIVFSKTNQLLSRSDFTGHGLHIRVTAKARLVVALKNLILPLLNDGRSFFTVDETFLSSLSNSSKTVNLSPLSPVISPISSSRSHLSSGVPVVVAGDEIYDRSDYLNCPREIPVITSNRKDNNFLDVDVTAKLIM